MRARGDAAVDAENTPGRLGDTRVLDQKLYRQRRIERPYRLDRQLRPAFMAVLETDETALQRGHALDRQRLRKPKNDLRQPQNIDAIGLRTAQNRFDMLRRVIDRPGVAVELFPFRLAHIGVRRERMLEIVFVEVGIERRTLVP